MFALWWRSFRLSELASEPFVIYAIKYGQIKSFNSDARIFLVKTVIHLYTLCKTKRIENELWKWSFNPLSSMTSAIKFVFTKIIVTSNVWMCGWKPQMVYVSNYQRYYGILFWRILHVSYQSNINYKYSYKSVAAVVYYMEYRKVQKSQALKPCSLYTINLITGTQTEDFDPQFHIYFCHSLNLNYNSK